MSRAIISTAALLLLAVGSIHAEDVSDEPSAVIAIDVTIVELKAATVGDKQMTLPDVSGSAGEVAKKIDELNGKGALAAYQHIHLTTVDNQPAMYQSGARTPVIRGVTSATRGALGGQSRTMSDENTGLIVTATPKVSSAGTIALQIDIERSALSDGPVLAEGADGQPIRSGITNTTTAQSTVSMPSGGSVILASSKSKAESVESQILILVRAEVMSPVAK